MAKEQLQSRIIGIDLGTSNSVAATAAGAQPKVLDSKEGRPQIPSIVGLKKRKGKDGTVETEILVGDVADDNWESASKDTIVSVKRLMGRGVADPEVQKVRRSVEYEIVEPSDGTRDSVRVIMGKQEYSPIDISAKILEKVKADAEFRLGGPVTHAVITVPAYFSQIQRRATRQAGLKAGLQVIKILDEPTAAAVAFGIEQQESSDPKYILVFDLGGGTFDISVLMWAGKVFAPLSLQGDMWLGGNNFDQVIVDHAVEHVKEMHGVDPTDNLRFMTALRRRARAVKERLSSARSGDLIVPGLLKDSDGDLVDVEMEVTREEFVSWIMPLVEKAVRLTHLALQDAGLTVDQVHHVLMAGNASAVPVVQQAMEKLFGAAKVVRSIHPKYAVAMGAAIVGTRIGPQVVCQGPDMTDQTRECGHVNEQGSSVCARCGRSLGLEAEENQDLEIGDGFLVVAGIAPFHYGTQTAGDKFNVFVRKGDPYPTENPETMTFYTSMPNQQMISIPVYGGDHLDKASANEKQGEAFAVLPPGLPQDTAVRVKLWLNGDCIFELTAHLEDGTDLHPWVLQGEADQKAVEAFQALQEAAHKIGHAMPPDLRREVEQGMREFFKRLNGKDFSGAGQLAEELKKKLAEGPKEEIFERAERLVGFAQMVTNRYGWALGAERTYRMNQLMGKLEEALRRKDHAAVPQLAEELDKATDDLGDLVWFLLNVRRAIVDEIRMHDPGLSDSLEADLDETEALMKARDPRAKARLEKLAEQAALALKKFRTKDECRNCGADLKGNRYCPKCKADSWALRDKKHSGTLSTISH
ncbi:MAG TPA: Hsp70 family protein [Symbiobacteriaceae bacterium]|nr:Hsp70 family protein [Symbiobacteriaceae bacterium]